MLRLLNIRYFVHVGFMMKIMSGEYHGEGISYEGEVLAIMAQGQLAFGLGLRGIIAFGISVSPSSGLTHPFAFSFCLAYCRSRP